MDKVAAGIHPAHDTAGLHCSRPVSCNGNSRLIHTVVYSAPGSIAAKSAYPEFLSPLAVGDGAPGHAIAHLGAGVHSVGQDAGPIHILITNDIVLGGDGNIRFHRQVADAALQFVGKGFG